MKKSVVILPSVQRNAGLDGYIEGIGMRIIAEEATKQLAKDPDYNVLMIWPGLETGPDFPVLRSQQQQAESWLRVQPGAYADKIVLNLHSDSGVRSHVLGLYGVGADGKKRSSYALAAAAAPTVAEAMRIRSVRVVSRLGTLNYSDYIFYREQFFTSALIECGSHENTHDVRILSDSPEVVAEGVVRGIRQYFKVDTTRPGIVWRRGIFTVTVPGGVVRAAPTRSAKVLRYTGPAVLHTDGYTQVGQMVAGSARWYHIARESGYGWIHSSAGRYADAEDYTVVAEKGSDRVARQR